MLITGMAKASNVTVVTDVTKVRATTMISNKLVTGLETYYGETFEAKDIRGHRSTDTLGKILSSDMIRLKNGKTYSTSEIEYALVPVTTKRTPGLGAVGDVFGPVSKAPHEQN